MEASALQLDYDSNALTSGTCCTFGHLFVSQWVREKNLFILQYVIILIAMETSGCIWVETPQTHCCSSPLATLCNFCCFFPSPQPPRSPWLAAAVCMCVYVCHRLHHWFWGSVWCSDWSRGRQCCRLWLSGKNRETRIPERFVPRFPWSSDAADNC